MSSLFGGGGGGGSPPAPPKLQTVKTGLGAPLYQQSARIGDEWANLMRGSYGLGQSTGPASWEAKYLGPGALAMMGQAGQMEARPGQDPQLRGVLNTAFGAPGGFFGASGGANWNLGRTPFQVAANLGQQFRAPLGQLQRGTQFTTGLLKQWQPPNLRLTGEDLLNVAMGTAAQRGQAAQQAFEAGLQGSIAGGQQEALANMAALQAWGKAGTGILNTALSPSLSSSGYYSPSFFAASPAFSGDVYGSGSATSEALGPAAESAFGGGS